MKTKTPIIITSFFILSIFILVPLFEIRLDTLSSFNKCALLSDSNSSSVASSSSSSDDEIRVLIGIMTLPDQYSRRHFLRLVYGTQYPLLHAKVDVKFVFCNLTKEEQKLLVSLEIMMYNDIIILNCTENMNNVKTYDFFSTLPEIFTENQYDYVMKGDDDIYIRLQNLVDSLRPLSRNDLYYGFVIPCESMNPYQNYMAGMGYLVSWDIVEWIRVSDIPLNHINGPEDKVFGDWMRDGRRGKNRVNAKWSIYDFPTQPTKCTHELWPGTIAVHRLKNDEMWVKTLFYFNVTSNLKESKLYHIS